VLDQSPASSLDKVSWEEVIKTGEEVSKQATMGILLSSPFPLFFSTTFCYQLRQCLSFLYSHVILGKWVLLILSYMLEILPQLLLVLILARSLCVFKSTGYIKFSREKKQKRNSGFHYQVLSFIIVDSLVHCSDAN
jgi:hypothetical protein